MQAAPGIVMKEGAEALDCAVALGAGLGVAVKVADGGYRAAGPAMIAVLGRARACSPAARRRAARGRAAAGRAAAGRRVGVLEPVVRLRTR